MEKDIFQRHLKESKIVDNVYHMSAAVADILRLIDRLDQFPGYAYGHTELKEDVLEWAINFESVFDAITENNPDADYMEELYNYTFQMLKEPVELGCETFSDLVAAAESEGRAVSRDEASREEMER